MAALTVEYCLYIRQESGSQNRSEMDVEENWTQPQIKLISVFEIEECATHGVIAMSCQQPVSHSRQIFLLWSCCRKERRRNAGMSVNPSAQWQFSAGVVFYTEGFWAQSFDFVVHFCQLNDPCFLRSYLSARRNAVPRIRNQIQVGALKFLTWLGFRKFNRMKLDSDDNLTEANYDTKLGTIVIHNAVYYHSKINFNSCVLMDCTTIISNILSC